MSIIAALLVAGILYHRRRGPGLRSIRRIELRPRRFAYTGDRVTDDFAERRGAIGGHEAVAEHQVAQGAGLRVSPRADADGRAPPGLGHRHGGDLAAGSGVSKTPLRDALLQLEMEGFVTILPRRKVVVNGLTPRRTSGIIYEIIGALESTALLRGLRPARRRRGAAAWRAQRRDEGRPSTGTTSTCTTRRTWPSTTSSSSLSGQRRPDQDRQHPEEAAVRFSPAARDSSRNGSRPRSASTPRSSTRSGEGPRARPAAQIRDVHWSFAVQEPFIVRYYTLALPAG